MSNVGIIGAGAMGRKVVETLAGAGHRVLLHDAAPGTAREWGGRAGVEVRPSASAVAAAADVVLMYLPTPAVVAGCVGGAGGLLETARAGTVLVDQSTVDPGTSERMAALAAARSVGYLDAPVLGRPSRVGQWTTVVGGRSEDLEKCRPLLSLVANRVLHVGPVGAGNRIKLLNQLMFGAINAMTAEMMAVAEKVGVPRKVLYETIADSGAGTVSNVFKELGARIAADDYENPTFSIDLLVKDVHLAAEMARSHGAPPLLARSVEFINEAARAQGLGKLDTAALWKCYAGFWGTRDDG
jgi:3-hydroxyisobutyrate dehydrogenase-like beta-hydroxyacid dehydrogenase